MVVAKAKPHHAQKPYILEITKNAPVPGAFLCSMKDIRVSGPCFLLCEIKPYTIQKAHKLGFLFLHIYKIHKLSR